MHVRREHTEFGHVKRVQSLRSQATTGRRKHRPAGFKTRFLKVRQANAFVRRMAYVQLGVRTFAGGVMFQAACNCASECGFAGHWLKLFGSG